VCNKKDKKRRKRKYSCLLRQKDYVHFHQQLGTIFKVAVDNLQKPQRKKKKKKTTNSKK
jgi:hypothetical protein